VRLRNLKLLQRLLIASACIGWAGVALAADGDADGVADGSDNCPVTANSDQSDADGDGYGDRCDADHDNNGVVDTADFDILMAAFGSAEGEPEFFAAGDHDGDGVIAGSDLAFTQGHVGQPVGQ
jgi:hypothetical protein